MSDTSKPGPVLEEGLNEVRGTFADEAALQRAMFLLTSAGFDRAQLNLPAPVPAAQATPSEGAETPLTSQDAQQVRTLTSSTAAVVGGMLGAGVTVMTGGVAAAAVAVAAAAGAAAGGGVLAASSAGQSSRRDAHSDRAVHGDLILAVTLQGDEDPARASSLMREAGATEVAGSRRVGARA